MLTILCPVCRSVLVKNEHSFLCSNGHCFDISKSGYVNLLPPSGSGHHGDDKLMVNARTLFLQKGFYAPLCKAVSEEAAQICRDSFCLIDAGCGEGYYSSSILTACLEKYQSVNMLGIDISKFALMALRKRNRQIQTVVASTASIPVENESADLLINIFSPLFEKEFHRVLRSGGYLLRVVPKEEHLVELKQLIYDKVYLNPAPERSLPDFQFIQAQDICFPMVLCSKEDILSLFQMTPYYYKTSPEGQKRAEAADHLTVSAAFEIQIYQKS